MCHLFLIRHGQASFGQKNYDKLSDLGRAQASALGRYYLNHSINFDQIIHGDLSRQTETAHLMSKAMGHKDDLVINASANEFDSDNFVKHYLPKFKKMNVMNRKPKYEQDDWFKQSYNFEIIFTQMMSFWQSDQNCPFESWKEFCLRVLSLRDELQHKSYLNQKIALVTSGGFISVFLQSILKFDDQVFIDVNLSINNASTSEFKLNTNLAEQKNQTLKNKLLCFNNISPLIATGQKELITKK